MDERTMRARMLLGGGAMDALRAAHVAVFGLGGVGSWCAEGLARSGVGELTLIDQDTASRSNINRQLCALESTVGLPKAEVMAARVRDINPDIAVHTVVGCYSGAERERFFVDYDYVVDAIDTVAGKIAIIEKANEAGVPVISSMGAGNKTDPTAFKVADLYDTSVCPLAKVMRKECKKRALKNVKVVYSTEKAVKQKSAPDSDDVNPCRRSTPGSLSFVPSVAGLIIAGEVIKDVSGYVPEYDD